VNSPHPQRESERGPNAVAERGGHERGRLVDREVQIRFEHRASRPVGRDAGPFTQTELQVVDRSIGPIGHGDSAPVLPVTDHRNDGAGHRQHVDTQDDKTIEDGCTADITQGIRDSSQAVRVHPSRRRERRSPRFLADGHVAHSHLGPGRSAALPHWASIGVQVIAACSSGTARDGLDVLPRDGLFELVALVVAGTRDRHKRPAPQRAEQ